MMTPQNAMNVHANNFTLLRLFAAFAVLYCHSYILSQGIQGVDPISKFLLRYWGEGLGDVAVDLFFCTSGFLVTASYIQRANLFSFVEARILRIYPALIVAIFFCVFVIGAAFTRDPILDFVSSPITHSYLKNNILLFNGIEFQLPSLFMDNPYPGINGSLWTLPIELRMYFWIALLGGLSLLGGVRSFNLTLFFLCAMYVQSPTNFFIVSEPHHVRFAFLFAMGGFFFINRDVVPLNFKILGLLCILVLLTNQQHFFGFVKNICFAYLIMLVAIHPRLRLPSIDRWGDISYGLYIYAFPVQETIAHLIPKVGPLSMFLLSTVVTAVLAIISWKLVEKPALRLKGKLKFEMFTGVTRTN